LPRIQFLIQQQRGHANNAVHRRSDLVTHVSQEFTLGASGCFSGLLGYSQVFLCFFACGDVPKHALAGDHVAGFVDHRHLDDVHPFFLAVRADQDLFRFKALSRLQQNFVDLPIFLRQVRRIDLEIGLTENLPWLFALVLTEMFIRKNESPFSVFPVNVDRNVVYQRL
jgi:hypothetical protein